MDIKLPEPCRPGQHFPCIVHRCGGEDANYWNRCGKCGREIQRGDGEPWVTQEQADDYWAEVRIEAKREYEEEMEEACHPEWRCPPRE